jgi:hypothetical protein
MTKGKLGNPSETGRSDNHITLLSICVVLITSALDFKIMDLGVAQAQSGGNRYYPRTGIVLEGVMDSIRQ